MLASVLGMLLAGSAGAAAAPPTDRLMVVKDPDGRINSPAMMQALLDQARSADKPLRYTVTLHTPPDYDPFLIGADTALEAKYRVLSVGLLDELNAELSGRLRGTVTEIIRLVPLPIFVVEADFDGLRALIGSPLVAGVYADVSLRPFLHQTLPLIEVSSLDAPANFGLGQAVAVLDSGVQLSHTMLSGKIVGQACFASGYPGYPACPPGHGSPSFLPGAGETCVGSSECHHGTHVSAIAVGHQRPTSQGPVVRGVASSASLVAVRVGSLTSDCEDPEAVPCLSFELTDTNHALAWIFNNRETLGVSAVNLSYGWYSTSFNQECSFYYPDIADQIAMLTGAGIAVVAATGNKGESFELSGRIAFPACVEHVIGVGAVDKNGAFAIYSNTSSEFLDLLAPGGIADSVSGGCSGLHQCVLSAAANSAYRYDFGTSMAAPHVSGAIAALRNIWPHPDVTVEAVLERLQLAGSPTTVSQYGPAYTKPLLKLEAAVSPAPEPIVLEPILMLILEN